MNEHAPLILDIAGTELTDVDRRRLSNPLTGGLKDWSDARGLTAHVTVTDETDYAASFVVVERTTTP